MFVVYYALVLCLWPGFYALYPTVERLRNVRALQYSNGVRPLPLWLANFAFDLGYTLVVSIISTALLSVGTDLWYVTYPIVSGSLPLQRSRIGMSANDLLCRYHLPYLFVILFLYGISSSILSYINVRQKSPRSMVFLCQRPSRILSSLFRSISRRAEQRRYRRSYSYSG